MPIEIGSVLGGICNKTYSITGLNVIFSSIINTAIVLTLITLILIMVIYPCKKNTPMWLLFKLFLYILISIVFVLYLHNSTIKNNYEKKYRNNNLEKFIGGMESNSITHSNDIIEVSPNHSKKDIKLNEMDKYDDLNVDLNDDLNDDLNNDLNDMDNVDNLLNKLDKEI
jgi:Ca2+/Na+ antiporter